jgi:putative membrane protein
MAQQEEIVDNRDNSHELLKEHKDLLHRHLISKKVSDHLANERTFLAWVRTAIAVIAFGFVVERFGLLLRQLGLKGNTVGGTIPYSKLLGIIITLLGIVLLVIALINFVQIRRSIDEERFHPGLTFPVLLTVVAALIGVLLAIYLSITT